MTDDVRSTFLENQQKEALALSNASDRVDIIPLGDEEPERYLVHFNCRGLVKNPSSGEIEEANDFALGIWFPPDYLRRLHPGQVVTWLDPLNTIHPNIKPPLFCVGNMAPGTPLVDLVTQAFEIITYNLVTMNEDDALDWDACQWARQHQHLFPVDRRPLRRRTALLDIEFEGEVA